MKVLFRYFMFVFLVLPFGVLDAVERLPVEAFASLPEMQDVQLSPDGKRIWLPDDPGRILLGFGNAVYKVDVNDGSYSVIHPLKKM